MKILILILDIVILVDVCRGHYLDTKDKICCCISVFILAFYIAAYLITGGQ